MSYGKNSTTYGLRTTAEVTALTGMKQGDTAFNTTIGKLEYYTGNIWINDDCVEARNATGETFDDGFTLAWVNNGTYQGAVELANDLDDNDMAGVVFRTTGNGAGDYVAVAYKGMYQVFMNFAYSAGNGVILDAAVAGEAAPTVTASTGVFGQVMEDGLADTLGYCMLQVCERF